jgi:hypothetical protein
MTSNAQAATTSGLIRRYAACRPATELNIRPITHEILERCRPVAKEVSLPGWSLDRASDRRHEMGREQALLEATDPADPHSTG